MARCPREDVHSGHTWLGDPSGKNWCKGLDATSAALIRALPHLDEGNVAGISSEVPDVILSMERTGTAMTMREIREKLGHKVADGDPETWAYHVETYAHESRIIKKYGDSNSGMIIAAYKDRGDARLVASLLNRLRDGEVDN